VIRPGRHVAHHHRAHPVVGGVEIGDGVVYGDHVADLRNGKTLNGAPHLLHPWSVCQLRDTGEIFVGIVHQRDTSQPAYQEVGEQGVEVVAVEQGRFSAEEEQDQETYVEAEVEQGTCFEPQFHPSGGVLTAVHCRTPSPAPSHQQHLKVHVAQLCTGAVHPPVGDQVVDHRDNHAALLHGAKLRENFGCWLLAFSCWLLAVGF